LKILLVHGAWHGTWCWAKLTPLLEQAGHEVTCVGLTGIGERLDDGPPNSGLERHARDVADHVETVGGPVVLVGHSYGSQVIRQAAELVPGQIRLLVYLDGPFPRDGESTFDALGDEVANEMRAQAAESEGGWRVPPAGPDGLGITDPDDATWAAALLTTQPLRSFEDGARLSSVEAAAIPGAYIASVSGALAEFGKGRIPFAKALGMPIVEIEAGHDLMIAAPEQTLAAIEHVIAVSLS